MTAHTDRTIREIERRHVDATGSDDFDTPAVARQTREALGLAQGSPQELYEVAVRAIEGSDLNDEERTAAKARAKAAVGL